MRIRWLVILAIALCFNLNTCFCDDGTSSSEDLITKQLDALDMESMQEYINELNQQGEGYLPSFSIKQLVSDLIQGKMVLSLKNIGNGLVRFFFKEVVANFDILGKIIVISILCALLQNLHQAFESDTIGKLAYGICYILIALLAMQSFSIAMKYSMGAIDSMVGFVQALMPTLLLLLTSAGSVTTSTVFQPLVFATIGLITTLIKVVIIPLIFFSAVLSIINNLSDSMNISKLASLLKQTAVGLLGLVLTIYLGIITVQGVVAASVDNVALKSAKFAVDNFVPVVGKFLSEAFDTVVGCSVLVKNGIGAAGLISLLVICAFPLIKMFSIIVIYKVSCALIQPVVDNQIVQCLSDMSGALMLLLCCVIAVGVLFFMAVTVVIGAGNMTVMLR